MALFKELQAFSWCDRGKLSETSVRMAGTGSRTWVLPITMRALFRLLYLLIYCFVHQVFVRVYFLSLNVIITLFILCRPCFHTECVSILALFCFHFCTGLFCASLFLGWGINISLLLNIYPEKSKQRRKVKQIPNY